MRRLADLFRALQKRNRFVGTAHDTGLDLAESHALVELAGSPDSSSADIQMMLGITKSASFRLFRRLKQRGLIKFRSSAGHSGHYRYALTPNGERALLAFDKAANANLDQFTAKLNEHDIKELLSFLEKLADWYRAAPSPCRRNDHILRPAVRRLTRAFGLLGDSVLRSRLSSVKWHVLHEVTYNPMVRFSLDLCRTLYLSPTTVSYTVGVLARNGLLKRRRNSEDSRYAALHATKKGRVVLERLANAFLADLEAGLADLSLDQLKKFAELMSVMTGEGDDSLRPELGDCKVRLARAPAERRELRNFLVRQLIRNQSPRCLPEVLFGKKSACFGLYKSDELAACLEIAPGAAARRPVLTNLAWDEKLLSAMDVKAFVAQCLARRLKELPAPYAAAELCGRELSLITEMMQSVPARIIRPSRL